MVENEIDGELPHHKHQFKHCDEYYVIFSLIRCVKRVFFLGCGFAFWILLPRLFRVVADKTFTYVAHQHGHICVPFRCSNLLTYLSNQWYRTRCARRAIDVPAKYAQWKSIVCQEGFKIGNWREISKHLYPTHQNESRTLFRKSGNPKLSESSKKSS